MSHAKVSTENYGTYGNLRETKSGLVTKWKELKSDEIDVNIATYHACDLRGALETGKITPQDLGCETKAEALRKIDQLVEEARRRG